MLSLLSLWFLTGFPAILVACLAFSVFWTSVTPLIETVAMAGVRAAGLDYGRIRLWGSVAYMCLNCVGGLVIARLGPSSILLLVVAMGLLTALCVEFLPRPRGLGRLRAATMPPKVTWRDAGALLRSPKFLVFVAVAATIQSSHGLMFTFGSLNWQRLGISSTLIGLLWATGVLAEIVVFAFAAHFVRRFSVARLLGLAAGFALVRWTAMAFNPPLGLVFVLQAMHGFTFGAAHLGAIGFMTREVRPELTATAQGIYSAVVGGVVLAAMTALCGPLYDTWKSEAFLAMALVAGLGLLGSLLLARDAQPQSSGPAGNTVAPS